MGFTYRWLRFFNNIFWRIFSTIPHLNIVGKLNLLQSLVGHILRDTGVALIAIFISFNAAEINISTASIHGLALLGYLDGLTLGVQEKLVNKVEIVPVIIDVLIVEKDVLEGASLADSCRGASKVP